MVGVVHRTEQHFHLRYLSVMYAEAVDNKKQWNGREIFLMGMTTMHIAVRDDRASIGERCDVKDDRNFIPI